MWVDQEPFLVAEEGPRRIKQNMKNTKTQVYPVLWRCLSHSVQELYQIKDGAVRAGPSSTSGAPRDTSPVGEHAESRGWEENTELFTAGICFGAEVLGLTQAHLKRPEDKDPAAAS